FEQDLMPAQTGHFGLTLIRTSALKRLKKPWFHSIPDENGSWGTGRQDADIFFWNNFKKSGCTMMLAPKVKIGHLQLMCTFPGALEDDLRPVHYHMKDVLKGKLPEGCVPTVNSKHKVID
ncbi:hypothetical protein LCGC14_2083580, partial [marine sediment metagenome]